MKSKKDKMLPEKCENSPSSPEPNNTNNFLGSIFSNLSRGESTNIEFKRNQNDSVTMRCSDQGKTIVQQKSGKAVGYLFNPKKK